MDNNIHSLIQQLIKKMKYNNKSQEDTHKKSKTQSSNKSTVKQHLRAVLIVRSMKEAPDALKKLKSIKGIFRYPPQELYYFSLSEGTVGIPDKPDNAASFYHNKISNFFDLVYVDNNIRLFDTSYGENFIAQTCELLNNTGLLVLPNWSIQYPRSGISPSRITILLDKKLHKASDSNFIIFDKPKSLKLNKPSILNWYLKHGAELVLQELSFRNNGFNLENIVNDKIVGEFLVTGELTADTDIVRGARSGKEYSQDFMTILNDIITSHAYLINGVVYKSALISHIIEKTMGKRTALRYADIGGGYGALASEILVSSPTEKFSLAITRDIASQNILMARNLYSGLNEHLKNRFKFSLGPAETFSFDDSYDIITFIGSLLYVEKTKLKEVVENAWNALQPGGLLIIHENIKNPAFKRDFDVMFEAEELNSLLNNYSTPRYFLSTAFSEISENESQNKTVFRVLQK